MKAKRFGGDLPSRKALGLAPRAFFLSIFSASNPRYSLKYFQPLLIHPLVNVLSHTKFIFKCLFPVIVVFGC